jgi:hypothetical protein
MSIYKGDANLDANLKVGRQKIIYKLYRIIDDHIHDLRYMKNLIHTEGWKRIKWRIYVEK